ncbi:MAG: zinc-dependent metalloprotease family protein [Flavobacteriales bacterium]
MNFAFFKGEPKLVLFRQILVLVYLYLSSVIFFSCQTENKKSPKNTTIVIALQPFGVFKPELLDSISSAIKGAYPISICVLEAISLPKKAFVQIKSARYRADSLLNYLKKIKPDTVDYIIGLTHADISTTKMDDKKQVKHPESKYGDWGVMGLGYMPGTSCVVSTYRLQHSNKAVFIARLKKVCIHELGHNFGLPHCHSSKCVMQDAAESIKTIDNVDMEPCKLCRKNYTKLFSLK